ncbi:AAA family ATPase [Alkalicaulis satelles]|uniref:DNA 3'-5' helicase n=1 Tax=Alkalicaulis satelles TaxID=2609175 RepID=A0A5M6ZJ00_9PROT|nr:UvrD-helicase domain-containing protein [Alkalicaulis satelles]KAA5803667.1 AAA family ATPase [Alkalicaulis satelles]
MSAPGFDPAVVEAASAAQRAAADPRASVFVEANAGSGKTRVLVDRVARLLLAGAAPERILCVTFTKAAAGEMQSRLFRKLGAWSVLPDEQLREEMAALTGGDGAPQDIAAARRLFARALETPGGLKIQTLHAFCESLLRRFPLEAGLAPGFEVQENASALAAEAVEAVYGEAARDPSGPMAQAIAQALDAGGAEGPANIAAFALARRHELGAALEAAGSPEALMDRASAALKVHPDTDEASALEAAWDETPVEDLEAALSALQSGSSVTEAKSTAALAEVLDAATRSGEEAINAYLDWVLTKAGSFKAPKSLYGKALGERYRILTTLYGEDGNERHRINDEVLPAIAAARANAATRAALRIALAVIAQYEARLKRLRKVDFADLVVRARALLTQSELGAWVRYKLDAGLDHVLVDEAQDTAPDQWAVVNALTEEFFSGAGARTDGGLRTVFCVGDEKQSIYSFQKADPRLFLAQRAQLQALSEGAGLDFASPALDASFRSAPEVLAAVDAAFAAEAAALGAPELKDAASLLERKLLMTDPETETERDALAFHRYAPHRAARQGMPGCVEIWPAIPRPESPAEDVIEEYGPLDAETDASARNQLAEAVAGEIAALIARGDAVWEEGRPWRQRPAGAGDVLVLVRRRDGLFEEIIRRLKMKNVPVAGADRMTLPDQLVVEDLLSLARFLLLPEDDLALAEILKSPLFHPVSSPEPLIDDDALYALSRRPGRGLWEKLRHSDDPRFAEARAALDSLRAQVETRAPYALFAGFLTGASATGESRLARIYARLGEEARDPVEEFLSRALAHEREGAPSLARFAAAMAADSGEIKREMEAGRGEVRVMTVHGAKGLEAPIVFLPDTTSLPKPPKGGLHAHAHAGLIWAPDSSAVPPLVQSMKERAELDQDGEYNRLLYVALTRARDRLVVCGYRQGHGEGRVAEGSWHDRCSRSWRGEGWRECATPLDALAARYGWEPEAGLRLGEAPAALGRAEALQTALAEPGWMRAPAPAEPAAPRAAAPSRLLDDEAGGFEPVSLSPLAEGAETRFRRGSLIHKLLQTLPDLPPERRAASGERYLAAQRDLTGAQRTEIITETLRVLDDPQFAALFAPGSRAEVSVSGRAPGLPGDVIIHGQIDRLVVTDHDVMIVDYKTNRPPPETADQVAGAYVAQMAAYRAVLQGLYPGKTVRCALLWTDGPRLMELEPGQLDAMLARLAGRARA